jgi:hypothetical protein
MPQKPQTSGCKLVEQALEAYTSIKSGVSRKEIEKSFVEEAGLQSPNYTRFVYRKCKYIKVEVEFIPSTDRGKNLTSPADSVKSVSRLYVEYSIKD